MSELSDDQGQGLSAFEVRLGHSFADRGLIRQALTHSSASGGRSVDNERLEFLGDRVLGLVCADLLVTRFPDAPEGTLAPRLNGLVCREACADVAKRLALGEVLVMHGSEARSGGRTKVGILADACEAVIAAVYRDAGMEAARAVIERHWAPLVAEVASFGRDPKTELQEWTQARWTQTPSYAVVERVGPDHDPNFTIEVSLPSGERAQGIGRSKREAERAAAIAMLDHINQVDAR